MAGALERAMDALDSNVAGKVSLHRKIEFIDRLRRIDEGRSCAGMLGPSPAPCKRAQHPLALHLANVVSLRHMQQDVVAMHSRHSRRPSCC